MFEDSSRYAKVPEARLELPGGGAVAYKLRRFLPRPEALPLLAEEALADGERLDHLAARVLGDPEQSWRILDANGAMSADEVEATPGRPLRIPVPHPEA